MARGSTHRSWLLLAAFASGTAGCGDDTPGAAPPGVVRLPVPGCVAIDPAPCDVFVTSCQERLMELAACMRGSSSPQALPPVSRMTEAELAQLWAAEIAAEERPPNLAHYEAALVMLGLVAPGAFAPASMASERASRVWGIYRSDLDDIVLIDRGLPGDDNEVVGVFLHELVHALQDRDQDLPTWYDAHTHGYDATLAAMSVVEGEARMHQQRFGVSLLGLDPNAVDLAKHFDATAHRTEAWVRAQASPYLASYSSFPYEFGGRMFWSRYAQRGPQAIAELYAAPPSGTRMLLDGANDTDVPAWPAPAAPAPSPEWTLAPELTTVLGAWGLSLVVARAGAPSNADALALGWRGDRMWVYTGTGVAGATAVVWRIAFADEATARLAAQGVPLPFAGQVSGADLVLARANSNLAVPWAFAPPAQSAPASSGEESQLAAASSVGDWLARAFTRTCGGRQDGIVCAR